MMIQTLKIAAGSIAISTLLTGCLLSSSVHKKMTNQYENKVQLSDKIIAVGLPKTPLTQYPDALVLAGVNYSYLVQSINRSTKKADKSLLNIFNQVNLNNLYLTQVKHGTGSYLSYLQKIENNEVPTAEMEQAADPDFYIQLNKGTRFNTVSTFDTSLFLLYYKGKNSLLSASEKKQLETLGFHCYNNLDSKKPANYCASNNAVSFTVAPAVEHPEQLKHKFRDPFTLRIATQQRDSDNFKSMAFLPVAVVVDLVTFPIQAGFCIATLGYCSGPKI